MKNKIRLTLAGLSAVALMFGKLAFAANVEDSFQKWLLNAHYAEYVSSNNSVAVNLGYSGSATEAVVTITGSLMSFYAPAGTLDTTGFTTSGASLTLTLAEFDTIGEVCDKIDDLSSYSCTQKGAKRNDNSTRLRDQTAASGTRDLKASGGADIKFDTAPLAGVETVESFDIRLGINPESGKRVTLKECQSDHIGGPNVQVSGKLKKHETSDGVTRNDTTNVWTSVGQSSITWSVNGVGGLEFAQDEHVVVSVGNASTLQNTTPLHLQCHWSEK